MPLHMARVGEIHHIKKITGKDEVRRHLMELGVVAGESLTIVSEIHGNLILNIKGSRIALDHQMARRIMV